MAFSVLFVYNAEGKKAFLREEGGTRSVTEGARATLNFDFLCYNAFSLSRLRRQLPPGGSLFMFTYNLSIFLTSTAFVATNTKIRHTSFEIYRILENCPLE